MVEVERLCKRFGTIVAAEDISFQVAQGETFGLLGPNGAGKSTTINMLCGLVPPDSGSVNLDGQTDPTRASVRRSLGVVGRGHADEDRVGLAERIVVGRDSELSGAHVGRQVLVRDVRDVAASSPMRYASQGAGESACVGC